MTAAEIIVPHETVNDETVTIVGWLAKTGERVVPGQPVVCLETSKSVVEVGAEAEGYLEILCAEKSEVAVGALLGRIQVEPLAPTRVSPESPTAIDVAAASPPPAPRLPDLSRNTGHAGKHQSGAASVNQMSAAVATTLSRFSERARNLMATRQIDPSVFAGLALVREHDVLAYLKRVPFGHDKGEALPVRTAIAHSQPTEAPLVEENHGAGIPEPILTAVTDPRSSGKKRLGLWHDLRSSSRDRGRSAVWLVWNYFWKGWLLRNLVRWAPYGIPQQIHRLRGVKVGKGCFIDPMAVVETIYGENVSIGDDVRISAGAMIMTHIKAPHFLRDGGLVPLVKKPVVLEDHCFIGVNAIIMPGVTVGRGAVVASGAVVLGNVPPFCMVAGNPAKVVKRFVPEASSECRAKAPP